MHPGEVPVLICILFPSGEKVFVKADKTFSVLPSEELTHAIEHELGEHSLYIAVDSRACLRPKKERTFAPRNGE